METKAPKGLQDDLSEIFCTVEGFLREPAAIVGDFLPVRLAHHEADRPLAIGVFLLFQIGPSHLKRFRKKGKKSTAVGAGHARLSI